MRTRLLPPACMPDLPGRGATPRMPHECPTCRAQVLSHVCAQVPLQKIPSCMLDDGDKDPQDPSVPEPSEAEQCATLINECVEHSEHAAQTCGSSGIFNKIGSALAGFNSRWVVDQ